MTELPGYILSAPVDTSFPRIELADLIKDLVAPQFVDQIPYYATQVPQYGPASYFIELEKYFSEQKELRKTSEQEKVPQKKSIQCPEHLNVLVMEEDPNTLRCPIPGCTIEARRKVPVKTKYETGMKYQMPEVLPQPSEHDEYEAYKALVLTSVSALEKEKVEQGKRTCDRIRRLQRMARYEQKRRTEVKFLEEDASK